MGFHLLVNSPLPWISFPGVALLILVCLTLLWIFEIAKGGSRVLTTSRAPVIGVSRSGKLSELRARYRYVKNGFDMIYDAYRENPDKILRVPVDQDLFLLPPKYIEELKSQPETVLSSTHAVSDYFLGQYTTLDVTLLGHVLWNVVQGKLTQRLGVLIDALQDELVYGSSIELPECQDWTPILVHPKILQLVARMNARVFVGPKLCRNKLWLDTSVDFSTCIFLGAGCLKIVPWLLRPIVAPFISYIRRIKRHHRNARDVLIPEIQRRRSEADGSQKNRPSQYQDVLQWLDDASSGNDLHPHRIVGRQLGLGFGATHGTTNHIVNVIYDLAARWDQYGAELRAEIEEVLEKSGGHITKSALASMSKLDSFMKESQRLNPGSALSFNRKVMSTHMLSDGTVLPRSAYIVIASGPMAASAAYHASPDTFDGLRFHRKHKGQAGAESGAQQFTTTNLGALMFGYGKFACPGRFFAGAESKLILVQLLRLYDLKLGHGGARPRNLSIADAHIPDPNVPILFRSRSM